MFCLQWQVLMSWSTIIDFLVNYCAQKMKGFEIHIPMWRHQTTNTYRIKIHGKINLTRLLSLLWAMCSCCVVLFHFFFCHEHEEHSCKTWGLTDTFRGEIHQKPHNWYFEDVFATIRAALHSGPFRKPNLHTDFKRLYVAAMGKCAESAEMSFIIFHHLLIFFLS